EEQKFSGNVDFTPNKDRLGIAIDAYIHHVIVNSGSTVLLSDVQGNYCTRFLFDSQAHIINQPSGHWDEGAEHKCNTTCHSLMLHHSHSDDAEPSDTSNQQSPSHKHPLQVGF
ncbi:hypothetical protein EDC04DRAFT_2583543, partial [Pisolithus marmoratus]